MAKGQKRSNKEIKKPKQQKSAAAAPASFEKGLSAPISKGAGKGRTNA